MSGADLEIVSQYLFHFKKSVAVCVSGWSGRAGGGSYHHS